MGVQPEVIKRQPFRKHLSDLRTTFIYCAAILIAFCVLGYLLHKQLFVFITKPLQQQLYYTSPAGALSSIFKLSLLFGLVVSLPLVLHQIYRFIGPSLPKQLRYKTLRTVFLSTFLAVVGVATAYWINLPATLHFLTSIGDDNIKPLITANEYINFVFNYLVGFAILFQLPLIMLLINRVKPQKPSGLMRYQRHVILWSFVAAAVITPTPDPLNQTMVALPIIGLYQLSIVMILVINWRARKLVPENAVTYVEQEAANPLVAGAYAPRSKPNLKPSTTALVSQPAMAALAAPRGLIVDIIPIRPT